MSDVDILRQMFRDEVVIGHDLSGNKASVTLTEPQCRSSHLQIVGLPPDAMTIRIDACCELEKTFRGEKGECKKADFVVIADLGAKKVILYIEMKARKGLRREVEQQLRGAHCFVMYCQHLGKEFWNAPDFLKSYRHRYVSVGHTSIPKRKTRIEKAYGNHDRPDRMMKVDWPHRLQFSQLTGS